MSTRLLVNLSSCPLNFNRKIMKKVVLLAIAVVLGFTTASAQRRQKQQLTPEQRVEKQMQRLDSKLNLTDEQEEEIKKLYTEFFNSKVNREERKSKMDELNKKIESLLTDEQKTTFSEMKNKKNNK